MSVVIRRLVPATVLAVLAGLLAAAPAHAAGSVSGKVIARTAGGAVSNYSGASVVFDRRTDSGTVSSSTTSQADGTFNISLPDGTYEVRTYPTDHGQLGQYGWEYYDDKWSYYGAEQVTVSGGAVTLRPIELRPTGKVVGTVRDEAGRPIAGATVSIGQGNGGYYGTTTDSAGRYDTLNGQYSKNLIPGSYVVTASPGTYGPDQPTYRYEEHPVTVSPGGVSTVDITLRERPRAVFTVLDTDGKPLANAPLNFQVRNAGGTWGPPQYGPNETDADGQYAFTDNFDEFKIQFGLPAGYAGSGVPEYWQDAYSFADAAILSFPAGVETVRSYTVQLATGPSVAGRAAAGKRLTASSGAWGAGIKDPAYQWLADDAEIPGATQPTYLVTNKVAGKRLGVRVTGTLANGERVSNTSTFTTRVVGVLKATKPRVVGAARQGRKLVARVKGWGPRPVSLTYTWLRDGKRIKGRSGQVYRLRAADVGHRISVRVTGRKASYATTTQVSRPTAKVRR